MVDDLPKNGRVARVFLSHKHADEEAARDLQRILQARSGQLQVTIYESKAGGVEWKDWIIETLRESDLLLLLYTDPSQEWDWCMYETGLFTPLHSDVKKPVICLYDPNGDPPKPLQGLEAVKIEVEGLVEKFLDPLYRSNQLAPVDPVLNGNLGNSELRDIAQEIVSAICPKRVMARYYLDRMAIGPVDASAVCRDGHIPDDTPVATPTARGLDVLNYVEDRFTWKDLKKQAEKPDSGTYWIEELEKAIAIAVRKKDPPILTSTFRGAGVGRIFRPVLYREGRVNGDPRFFFVAFNEEIEPELIAMRGNCGLAFNLLRLGTRFRGEVIDPFINRLGRASGTNEIRTRCRELVESITAIEDESLRHEHLSADTLVELFPPASQSEITEMLRDWQDIRQTLCNGAAAGDPDVPALLDALRRLRTMNRRFMSLVSQRYAELLAADVEDAPARPDHLEATN